MSVKIKKVSCTDSLGNIDGFKEVLVSDNMLSDLQSKPIVISTLGISNLKSVINRELTPSIEPTDLTIGRLSYLLAFDRRFGEILVDCSNSGFSLHPKAPIFNINAFFADVVSGICSDLDSSFSDNQDLSDVLDKVRKAACTTCILFGNEDESILYEIRLELKKAKEVEASGVASGDIRSDESILRNVFIEPNNTVIRTTFGVFIEN